MPQRQPATWMELIRSNRIVQIMLTRPTYGISNFLAYLRAFWRMRWSLASWTMSAHWTSIICKTRASDWLSRAKRAITFRLSLSTSSSNLTQWLLDNNSSSLSTISSRSMVKDSWRSSRGRTRSDRSKLCHAPSSKRFCLVSHGLRSTSNLSMVKPSASSTWPTRRLASFIS